MIRLSDERIKELESIIRKSKVLYEEVKKTLEKFDKKNAELFAHGELSHRDYSNLYTKVSAPCAQILNNLPSRLDDIAKFAHVRTTAPLYAIDETLRSGEWIDLLIVLKDIGFSLNTLFEKPLPASGQKLFVGGNKMLTAFKGHECYFLSGMHTAYQLYYNVYLRVLDNILVV